VLCAEINERHYVLDPTPRSEEEERIAHEIFLFFNKKCYFDDVYNMLIIRPVIRLSYVFNRAVEEGLFMTLLSCIWRGLHFPLKVKTYYAARFSLLRHLAQVFFCLFLVAIILA
jgi:hypothetical protein